jgi:hypothetical protein
MVRKESVYSLQKANDQQNYQGKDVVAGKGNPCRSFVKTCRNQLFFRSWVGVMPVCCLIKWLKWD